MGVIAGTERQLILVLAIVLISQCLHCLLEYSSIKSVLVLHLDIIAIQDFVDTAFFLSKPFALIRQSNRWQPGCIQ
jgi:hypothetical protein